MSGNVKRINIEILTKWRFILFKLSIRVHVMLINDYWYDILLYFVLYLTLCGKSGQMMLRLSFFRGAFVHRAEKQDDPTKARDC